MSSPDLLGKGFDFPLRFDITDGGTLRSPGDSHQIAVINASIAHILTTNIGERYYLPEFGSRLGTLVFEPIDEVLVDTAREYILESIARWEKRIVVTDIQALLTSDNSENSRVDFAISYEIIRTRVEGNYVYPFETQPEPVP